MLTKIVLSKTEDKKGIAGLTGIMLAIFMLIVFFSFLPSVIEFIPIGSNLTESDTLVSTSMYFIIPFMFIVILIIALVLMRG